MNLPSHPQVILQWTLLAIMLASGCRAESPNTSVQFESADVTIKDKKFTLEIADNKDRRELGLMNRESMPADHGMLFVFDAPDIYSFWMKNTKIPLDLVFLDASGKVVGIYPLKANDETPVTCEKKSLFAIELNAGAAKSVGLKVGDSITLPEKVLKRNSRSDEK